MYKDKCTKCGHSEYAHRQRDVRIWALDECASTNCYCQLFSSSKKLIDKYTRQGIPKNLIEDEHDLWFIDILQRTRIEYNALLRLGIKLRGMYYKTF